MFCAVQAFFLVIFTGVCLGSLCDLELPSILKLSVTSLRNNTGHWISKMQLEHDADYKEISPWTVNMEHRRKECQGSDKIIIDINTIVPPKSRRSTPPTGYQLAPGFGYYKIHPPIDRWMEALEACEQEGGHLWIVNSEAEAQAVHQLIVKTDEPNAWYWIGFHNRYVRGQFLTVFNESLEEAGYTTWGDGEQTLGECGFFKIKVGLGTGTCELPRPFICELYFINIQI